MTSLNPPCLAPDVRGPTCLYSKVAVISKKAFRSPGGTRHRKGERVALEAAAIDVDTPDRCEAELFEEPRVGGGGRLGRAGLAAAARCTAAPRDEGVGSDQL